MADKEWLCVLRPTRLGMLTEAPTETEIEVVGRHFAYQKDLTEKGVAILVGRTENKDERTIGLSIFRAPSEEDAWQIVKSDPAVAEGVMTAELFPYMIALRGF